MFLSMTMEEEEEEEEEEAEEEQFCFQLMCNGLFNFDVIIMRSSNVGWTLYVFIDVLIFF